MSRDLVSANQDPGFCINSCRHFCLQEDGAKEESMGRQESETDFVEDHVIRRYREMDKLVESVYKSLNGVWMPL